MNSSKSYCSPASVSNEQKINYITPRYDVDRSGDETRLRVELSGVAKEDLVMTVENRQLLIEGKSSWAKPESWKPLHRESSDRSYRLRLSLGEQVNQPGIVAELVDGILAVVIPREEAAKPRSIKVQ
jgi:HSP20 family molecular chaperone IbpA